MASVQLRLLPPARPLEARFGSAFFHQAPACPGVYVFADDQHRALYVGQSRNLRQRLRSYQNLHPDRAPRRLVRLVHATHSITWEVCASAAEARVRENHLLRLHKPRFNRVNTRPELAVFLSVADGPNGLSVRVLHAARNSPSPRTTIHGAFKSARLVRGSLAALARLLWWVASPTAPFHELPRSLLAERVPPEVTLPLRYPAASPWADAIKGFFAGTSDLLIHELEAQLAARPELPRFQRALWENDLDTLRTFLATGPRRNAELRAHFRLTDPLILPADLDDLLARRASER